MDNVEIKGAKYLIGKLDVFKQAHVARRIAPIMAGIGQSLFTLAKSGTVDDQDLLPSIMGPALEVVAKMTDTDFDYVVQTCLAVVSRMDGQPPRPQKVMNGATMIYSDIDLLMMIQLVTEVVKENLGGFFPLLSGAMTSEPGSDMQTPAPLS